MADTATTRPRSVPSYAQPTMSTSIKAVSPIPGQARPTNLGRLPVSHHSIGNQSSTTGDPSQAHVGTRASPCQPDRRAKKVNGPPFSNDGHRDSLKPKEASESDPGEGPSRPRPFAKGKARAGSMKGRSSSTQNKKIPYDLGQDLRETRESNRETRDSNLETRALIRGINNTVAALQNAVQGQMENHETQMRNKEMQHQEQVATLAANHGTQMEAQESRHQEQMAALAAQTGNQEARHQEQMATLAADHGTQMEAQESRHQEQMAALAANHEAQMENQRTQHQEQVATLAANHEAQMENQRTQYQEQMATLATQMRNQEAQYQEQMAAIPQTIARAVKSELHPGLGVFVFRNEEDFVRSKKKSGQIIQLTGRVWARRR
ncbi:uncharacterized protein Z519_09896 [Cladophialophora bantiana CBS 173.52]|uniref:Uncharacterized protein n=1 Tax=Cladophialophora bantiana (strain ATCC 10958 / CBS 173.52 / CDC B-1940 / NIH 8579) TaxID=1442370 RepID=A0A0D2HYP0_CLAB1|nr:uncharacterized protein Z519_09896 [Cladophialophora bantiana CBS 173.52]KIW89739.1 hypothetical protein Z519_09896 [Cladophialophora bantiana CBS 173.52]